MKFWEKWKAPSGIMWNLIAMGILTALSEVHGYEFGILICAMFGIFAWKLQIRINRILDAIERTKKACLEYQEILEVLKNNFDMHGKINSINDVNVGSNKTENSHYIMLNARLNSHYSSLISELKLINRLNRKQIDFSKIRKVHKKIYTSTLNIINRAIHDLHFSSPNTNLCIKMLKEIDAIVELLNEESAKLIS